MTDVLVLGAGIAGLAASSTATQMGRSSIVLEAESRAGGLLDSFEVDGFRFDNAVHLSFASESEVRAVFDQTRWFEHDAVSYCRDGQHWLKHPVQNNLFPLDLDEKINLIKSFVERPNREINNYQDWLVYQYGIEIAKRWPIEYTRKYWTVEAEELGTRWIGQRMRRADLTEVLRGSFIPDTPNTYYVQRMRYPTHGGYRAFIEPLIEACDIRLNNKVTQICPDRRIVSTADGGSYEYKNLVSTLPLPIMSRIIPSMPQDVAKDAASLFATSVDLVSIGLSRPHNLPSIWAYIYNRDIAAARVYSPSSKSPHNAPAGCSSLQFEIYSSRVKPQDLSVPEMIENSIYAMEQMGVACRDDILLSHHKHVAWANVVFDANMESRRDRVLAWLAGKGIKTAGRFGEWDYLWSNQSFMSGMRAAQSLQPGSTS